MKRLAILSAALLSATATPALAATQIYVAPDGLAGNQAYTGTLGLNFDVNRAIKITALGVFDSLSNGLASNLGVTIFDRNTGISVLNPVFFNNPTPNPNGTSYLFQNVAPLVLASGQYQLAAWNYGSAEMNYNNSGPGGPITFNNLGGRITAVGTQYGSTPGVLATIDDNGLTRYGAGSLIASAAPEPATWAMMLAGFGMVGGTMRSARRKQRMNVSFA